jgi:hypothetical protein
MKVLLVVPAFLVLSAAAALRPVKPCELHPESGNLTRMPCTIRPPPEVLAHFSIDDSYLLERLPPVGRLRHQTDSPLFFNYKKEAEARNGIRPWPDDADILMPVAMADLLAEGGSEGRDFLYAAMEWKTDDKHNSKLLEYLRGWHEAIDRDGKFNHPPAGAPPIMSLEELAFFQRSEAEKIAVDQKVWIASSPASAPGIVAHWHYDQRDNFFLQIRGRKNIRLKPPTAEMKVFPMQHPLARQFRYLEESDARALAGSGHKGHELMKREAEEKEKVDEDDADASTAAAGEECLADEYFDIVIEPGVVLYIPPLWFHRVTSLGSDGNEQSGSGTGSMGVDSHANTGSGGGVTISLSNMFQSYEVLVKQTTRWKMPRSTKYVTANMARWDDAKVGRAVVFLDEYAGLELIARLASDRYAITKAAQDKNYNRKIAALCAKARAIRRRAKDNQGNDTPYNATHLALLAEEGRNMRRYTETVLSLRSPPEAGSIEAEEAANMNAIMETYIKNDAEWYLRRWIGKGLLPRRGQEYNRKVAEVLSSCYVHAPTM